MTAHTHDGFVRVMTPVEPFRVYNSREEGGRLEPGETRRVPVGFDGAVVHVTAIDTLAAGFLSISGNEDGNATSLVNFDDDGTESANAPILLPEQDVFITTIAACHIAVDIYAILTDVPVSFP